MELRQVRLFLAAAEEGSITAAARRMNLTQPALSRQIKALEEELGVELFTRGAHSVALTPAGRVLAEEGGKLLDRAERVVTRMFRDHGIDAKIAGEFDGVSSLGAAVEAGLGVALVAAGSRIDRVAMLPLDPAPEAVCVAAGLPAGREVSPVTGVFVGELQRVAGEEAPTSAGP